MIRFTGTSGIAIYINPDKIIGFAEDVNRYGTFINYGRDQYIVTESPEEVARKVLEWRMAWQVKSSETLYQLSGLKTPWQEEAEKIADKILAGLEEPNHDEG